MTKPYECGDACPDAAEAKCKTTRPGNPIVYVGKVNTGKTEPLRVRLVYMRNLHAGAEAVPTILVEQMDGKDSQGADAWVSVCGVTDDVAEFGMLVARSPGWTHEAVTRDEVLAACFASYRFDRGRR